MRPEERTTMSTPTYTVTAENRCNPYITYTIQNLTDKQARFAIKNLWTAFRSIEVVNEETGEVVYSHYEGDEFFQPSETVAEAIAKVNAIFSM
jgi:hypothetical protein